jgi:hypothetical protein
MSVHTDLRRRAWLWAAAVLLLFALVFVLVWGLNMRRGLNHDEHQFVASAALIARDGLLPYRDFPYFHVPTLSFIYAALFGATDYLLLAARAFSIVCSWLTLALIFAAAVAWLRQPSLALRLGIGAAAVLLLMTTPSFLHASGRAWNHDFPILLTLAAAVLHVTWLKRAQHARTDPSQHAHAVSPAPALAVPPAVAPSAATRRAPAAPPLWWLVAEGALLGLAASARLTFALATAAFVLSIFFVLPWRTRQAWWAVALFVAGALIGALPAFYMFAVAPAAFIFGNFTYAQLNTAFYREAAAAGAAQGLAMTLGAKLLKTLEHVVTEPGNLLLFLLTVFALWRARRHLRRAPELIFLLLLLLCFLVGAYAPTPLQQQYIYLLFPLALLIFLAALAYDARPQLGAGLLAAAALISAVLAAPRYGEGLAVAFDPAEWFPLKVHARGEYAADLVGRHPILTLGPIYPLEGRAPIYPEFVTGPLAWRVAPLLSAEERRGLGIVGLEELAADLATQPPRAILAGLDNSDVDEEAPVVAYAEAQGYVPIPLPDEGTLWASPVAAWGDRIHLGAAGLPLAAVAGGDDVLVTLHLQATAPITSNLNVLVRLVDAGGEELMRSEGWPWGRATSTWPVGEVWPDGHTIAIPPAAAPGPYRVEVSFYDPATLELLGSPSTVGHVVVAATPAAGRSRSDAPRAQFGDGIALLEADVAASGWTPGATQEVHLVWQAATPTRGRYTVFLHLIGPDGTPVAQGDREPWQGTYGTDAWLQEVPARDSYPLVLPPDLPSGSYTLVVGLYDPVTGQRLPRMEDGQAHSDSYQLATIAVP